MPGLSIDRLIFDPADLTESSNIGAYTRAGSDGDLISSTNVAGKEGLDVNLINASLEVTATNLDIRDLSHTQDSVKLGDGTDFLAINVDGSINAITSSQTAYAEDSAHASGALGDFSLGVRQDALASSTSADGDYSAFKMTSRGALWTTAVGTSADDAADTEAPIKVGSKATGSALSPVSTTGDRADLTSDMYRRIFINDSPNIGVSSQLLTVGATEVAFPAALGGRRRLMVQNTSNNDVCVGPTGLSMSSGLRVGKGSTLSLEVGENVNLFSISGSAGNAIRIFELA